MCATTISRNTLGAAVPAAPPLPPPPPIVQPFGNNKDWIVVQDMAYRIGNTADFIVVPKGFVTDFASIPPALAAIGLSPHDQYSRAAVIHDYLYWTQGCKRDQADRLLVIVMKESNVGKVDEWLVYNGVDNFGKGPWEGNQKERAQGLPRLVPDEYLTPPDPNMAWKDYRKMLFSKGVRDPQFDSAPVYCKYGNTMNVPS